jgi:cysteinyl-tRNA synthetase
MIIRYALLQSKYREDRMWDESVLSSAHKAVVRIRLNLSKSEVAPSGPLLEHLITALSADLVASSALLAINKWCEASEKEPQVDEAGIVSRALDSLLGLAL